jgi:hypothetical protein
MGNRSSRLVFLNNAVFVADPVGTYYGTTFGLAKPEELTVGREVTADEIARCCTRTAERLDDLNIQSCRMIAGHWQILQASRSSKDSRNPTLDQYQNMIV